SSLSVWSLRPSHFFPYATLFRSYASITGSSLSVFALSLQPSDGKSYLAVTASGLGGSLHVGSVASADFAGVSLKVNQASGVGATTVGGDDVTSDTVSLRMLSGDF